MPVYYNIYDQLADLDERLTHNDRAVSNLDGRIDDINTTIDTTHNYIIGRLDDIDDRLSGRSGDDVPVSADEPARDRDIINVLRQLLADRGYSVFSHSCEHNYTRSISFRPTVNGE